MSKPVVFVIGATGNVGSATVQSLSARFSDKLEIRAGSRNPDKADKLKDLKGVSVVQAEMGAKDNLVHILKGVDTLFINTPTTENRAELVIATVEAAKMAGVKHVLVVSVPVAGLEHTVFGKQFGEIETAVSKLGVPYTFLRLPAFFENNFFFKSTIQKQSHIYLPMDPTKPLAAVSCEDAGLASAVILSDPGKHANKTYNIVSDRYTLSDVVACLSEVLGREVTYVRVPYEMTKKTFLGFGMPEYAANGALELYELIDSGSSAVNPEDINDFERITCEKPTSFKTWLNRVQDTFK